MRTALTAFLVFFAYSSPFVAAEQPTAPLRPLPPHCAAHTAEAGERDADWNDAYRRGFRAIEAGDHVTAERAMCVALFDARSFEPRDWRYAETLDELGLIAFSLGDFVLAEQLQGAAIVEMLLAAGPGGNPLRDRAVSPDSPLREECRSGVRAYVTRLGWIHERLDGSPAVSIDELRNSPWRIFEAGYVPVDGVLAARLEWLVSQYLLEENMAAVEVLVGVQRSARRRIAAPT